MYACTYRAVLWPAAWAVSNYLLSEPDLRDNLSSLSILELGTGTGLVSLATAMGGCKRVLATDYEPLALELTRYTADNINDNVCISEDSDCPLSERIETRILDLCALEEQPLPLTSEGDAKDFDIVVAADIMVCFTCITETGNQTFFLTDDAFFVIFGIVRTKHRYRHGPQSCRGVATKLPSDCGRQSRPGGTSRVFEDIT